jgi:inorganic pyrophosphatase
MLEMIDGGESVADEKILCVPARESRYAEVKSLKDVSPHRLEEIAEFFQNL